MSSLKYKPLEHFECAAEHLTLTSISIAPFFVAVCLYLHLGLTIDILIQPLYCDLRLPHFNSRINCVQVEFWLDAGFTWHASKHSLRQPYRVARLPRAANLLLVDRDGLSFLVYERRERAYSSTPSHSRTQSLKLANQINRFQIPLLKSAQCPRARCFSCMFLLAARERMTVTPVSKVTEYETRSL